MTESGAGTTAEEDHPEPKKPRKAESAKDAAAARTAKESIFGALGSRREPQTPAANIAKTAPKGAALKELNTSDSISTEAAQLVQQFDDLDTLVTINEAKIKSVLSKVEARLVPQLVSTVCGSESDDRGLRVTATLRQLKLKLQAALPLAASLAAAAGESFHPDCLRSAVNQVQQAGIKLSPGVFDILAVREVTFLADSFDWQGLVSKLVATGTGKNSLAEDSCIELCSRGCIHAVESVMRASLPPGEQGIPSLAVCNERGQQLQGLIECLRAEQALWNWEPLQDVCSELANLEILLKFAKEENVVSVDQDFISSVEKARTLLSSKSSSLLRSLTALPFGVYLMDTTQEKLAFFHSNSQMLSVLQGLNHGTSNSCAFTFFIYIYNIYYIYNLT